MPRFTNAQCVLDSLRLCYLRLKDSGRFALLSMTEQGLLHLYFQPDKDLNSQDRITYRVLVTKTNPTLPQQAGRALAKLSARVAIEAVRRSNPSSLPLSRSYRWLGKTIDYFTISKV
jgi:hypothetical protein